MLLFARRVNKPAHMMHPIRASFMDIYPTHVSSRVGSPTWKKSMDSWLIPWIATQI